MEGLWHRPAPVRRGEAPRGFRFVRRFDPHMRVGAVLLVTFDDKSQHLAEVTCVATQLQDFSQVALTFELEFRDAGVSANGR